MARWWGAVGFAVVLGCGPRFVESSGEIDAFLARGSYEYACVAFRSSDDGLRSYAATRLAKFPDQQVATDCVCAALYDAEKGTWDAAVAEGLAGSRRDDLAACLQPAAADARVSKRPELIEALGRFLAPAGWEALAALVTAEPDASLRAAAVGGLRGSQAHTALLQRLAAEDTDAGVRAAALAALKGHPRKAVEATLIDRATHDADEQVRLAAITVLGEEHTRESDAVLCEAMLKDPAASVRQAAIASFAGTKSKRGVDCLRARLLTLEDDATVRQAVLDALKTSPDEGASAALCESIGPFVRMYIKDKDVGKTGGADIVEAQNHNHWEVSYQCVQGALAQGGYTCYARNYLAHWFKQLGGDITPPWCPGMAKN